MNGQIKTIRRDIRLAQIIGGNAIRVQVEDLKKTLRLRKRINRTCLRNVFKERAGIAFKVRRRCIDCHVLPLVILI